MSSAPTSPEPRDDATRLLAELLEDRREAKEKERREAWSKYTTMTVVVIAVLAAIANQWATRYTTRTLHASGQMAWTFLT